MIVCWPHDRITCGAGESIAPVLGKNSMIRRRAARNSRTLAVVLWGLMASGLSVHAQQGSPGAGSSVARVNDVKIVFDPMPREGQRVQATNNIQRPRPDAFFPEVKEATADFASFFAEAFRTRFAPLAQRYNLALSPTAATILTVNVVRSQSRCHTACTHQFFLTAALVRAGSVIWTNDSYVTVTRATTRDFDDWAKELLAAMKKAGIVG